MSRDDLEDPYRVRQRHTRGSQQTAGSRGAAPSHGSQGAGSRASASPSPDEAGPSQHRSVPSSSARQSDVPLAAAAEAAQEADEEIEEHDKDRYYALLNVDRDATEERIREAYRALAVALHPDKHRGESAKAAAQSRFREVQKAYEVLSDREKRNVYDYFGEDGLNSTWSISLRGRTQEELRAEYERQKSLQRVQEAEELVNSKGEYTAKIDARALFAPSEHIPRPVNRRGEPVSVGDRWNLVGANTLIGKHGFETSLTSRTGVKLSGEMVSRNGRGGGNLYATVKNIWSPRLATETTVSLMQPTIAMLDATYNLDEYTFFTGQLSGSTLELPPTAHLTYAQRLSLESQILGFVSVHSGTYNLGPWGRSLLDGSGGRMVEPQPPLVMVGLTNTLGGGAGWSLHTQLGMRDFGVSATRSVIAKWLGGAKLKTALKLGLMSGARISAGAEKAVTDVMKLSFGVALGFPAGVSIQLGFKRLGQTIKIPIELSRDPRMDLAFLAAFVPLSGLFALETYYLGPQKRRKVSNRLDELRRDNWDLIQERRQAAKEAVRVLSSQATKSAASERGKAGLIILDAHYGRADALPALGQLSEDTEEMDRLAWPHVNGEEDPDSPDASQDVGNEEDETSTNAAAFTPHQLSCDVKTPLQALVHKSKLIIPGGRSKSNLLGFYDAAMGERKVLRLRYLFRNRVHEVVFADKDPVAAPMRAHQL